MFSNFELLQQLTTIGTQFRWQDDPSQTIYTVKDIRKSGPVQNYDAQLPNGDDYGTSPGGKILYILGDPFLRVRLPL